MPSPISGAPRRATKCHSGNAREDVRSNVFVMAALVSATSSSPVRIRNMSRSGALVEGGVVPPVGKDVRLCRGSLSVSGRVVWRNDSRAGLRFKSAIVVADWLPRGNRSSPQQYIDEIVFQAKCSGRRPEDPAPASPEGAIDIQSRAAAQLRQFGETLDRIAGEFADDAAVATQFQVQLQFLDLIAQALARLAIVMASPPPGRD